MGSSGNAEYMGVHSGQLQCTKLVKSSHVQKGTQMDTPYIRHQIFVEKAVKPDLFGKTSSLMSTFPPSLF